MALYEGNPVFANGITLPDDGVPPQAGEINPGLEGCWDAALWLKREISRAFSRFSAKNFVNSNYTLALQVNPTDIPSADTKPTALAASSEWFYLALRDGTAPDSVSVVRTRDGFGWGIRASVALTVASNREYGAIAAKSADALGATEWLVLAHSARGSGGAGQRIDVVSPAGVVNTGTRGALSNSCNYAAAAFVGERVYAFGATTTFDGVAVGANAARVVSASVAGSCLDWATPSGGVLSGNLALATGWRVAVNGTIAVATVPQSDDYVRVDSVTNTVTQLTLPSTDGDITNSNPVVWGGKFWLAKVKVGVGTYIYSSPDGYSWEVASALPGVFIAALAAEQSILVAFESFNPIAKTGDGSYQTIDGVAWDRTALSTQLIATAQVASTASRSAVLRFVDVPYLNMPSNLRVSLGGLL